MEEYQVTLKNDVLSFFSEKKGKSLPRKKYASKGDTVTVVEDHNGILIVERKDGERFAVRESETLNK